MSEQGGKPAFEVPDLDLPIEAPAPKAAPSRPVAAPTPRRAAAPPSHDPSAYFGSGNFDFGDGDDDLGGGSGVALGGDAGRGFGDEALALGSSIDVGGEFDAFEQAKSTGSGRFEVSGGPGPKRGGDQTWPSGNTPERATLRVDEVEVRLLADYGDPPKNALLAPLYTWRVWSRRRVLRPLLAEAERDFVGAEVERDQLLGGLVEQARGEMERDDGMKRWLEPLHDHEATTRERSAALASTNDEYQGQAMQLDLERQHLASEVAARQELMQADVADLGVKQEAFGRADAKFKRAHIEIRSAKQLADQWRDAGQAVPPPHLAKLAELEGAAAALVSEHSRVRAERDAAKAVVDGHERALAELRRGERGVEQRQRALDDSFKKQFDVRAAGVSAAETAYRRALADVGRRVLATRGGVDVLPGVISAIAAADATLAARAQRAELALRAYGSADEGAYRRGIVVVLVAAGLIVVAIVLAVAL